MAESDSPAFMPPVNTVRDNDPMIVRVPLDKTDYGFRKSAAPEIKNDFVISHVKNGQ